MSHDIRKVARQVMGIEKQAQTFIEVDEVDRRPPGGKEHGRVRKSLALGQYGLKVLGTLQHGLYLEFPPGEVEKLIEILKQLPYTGGGEE